MELPDITGNLVAQIIGGILGGLVVYVLARLGKYLPPEKRGERAGKQAEEQFTAYVIAIEKLGTSGPFLLLLQSFHYLALASAMSALAGTLFLIGIFFDDHSEWVSLMKKASVLLSFLAAISFFGAILQMIRARRVLIKPTQKSDPPPSVPAHTQSGTPKPRKTPAAKPSR